MKIVNIAPGWASEATFFILLTKVGSNIKREMNRINFSKIWGYPWYNNLIEGVDNGCVQTGANN